MLQIDANSLQKNLKKISQFGALKGGGITRLAFSNEEKEARAYLKEQIRQIGFSVKEDAIGNIFAILEGSDPLLPPVMSGSHLDSVPNGGYYDGALGVICALEGIKSIQKSKLPFKRSLGLIVFSCEESSRFNIATVGSKLISGKLPFHRLHKIKDKNKISIYEAAKQFDCDVENSTNIILKNHSFYSYIELHIEQGPILERKKVPLGIVLAIAAPIRYSLKIIGHADHSGATPMDMRKDALVCAAEIIVEIEKIACGGKTTVATVGYANTTPGVLNVIPECVELGIDIRDIDKDALIATDKAINDIIGKIVLQRGLRHELKSLAKDYPVRMDTKIITTLEQEAKKTNIQYIKLPSGAGHDAMNMKNIATHTGMLFIPCKDGISHNTKEDINIKDAVKATQILANSMLTLANEE